MEPDVTSVYILYSIYADTRSYTVMSMVISRESEIIKLSLHHTWAQTCPHFLPNTSCLKHADIAAMQIFFRVNQLIRHLVFLATGAKIMRSQDPYYFIYWSTLNLTSWSTIYLIYWNTLYLVNWGNPDTGVRIYAIPSRYSNIPQVKEHACKWPLSCLS